MSDLHREKDENKTENEDQNDEENDSTQSFTEAVREKYCFDGSDYTFGSCQITFHGKAGTGGAKAELAHLRNVVLCNSNLTYAGIPREGLASLCPNVIDLDISGNNLTSWKEILPIFQQLTHLKFVNLGGNPIQTDQDYLEGIDKPLSNVENLVLNGTFIRWKDVLKFVKRLPELKEIHVCYNDYEEFSGMEKDDLKNIECFRANNNNIQKWSEVWKLRHLPKLHSLILSGNPVKDIFFDYNCCTGDHDDCQEPIADCDPKVQNCDETLVESADQNSSHLVASSCDTSDSSKVQQSSESSKELSSGTSKEQPSETSKELSSGTSKEQPSETSKELSSETSKEQPSGTSKEQPSLTSKEQPSETSKELSENGSQNIIRNVQDHTCPNLSRNQTSKDENEEEKSTDVLTTDQGEASNNLELEEEFQTMVTELLKVADKMAHQKSSPIKRTKRYRYDSLQSEDGDYDDCPKQMANSLGQVASSLGHVANSLGQMANSLGQTASSLGQVANSLGQLSPKIARQIQADETGQMPHDVVGQMQANKIGQLPQKMGQMPPQVHEQMVRDMPKDGQIPTETIGQMPTKTLEQKPSEMSGQSQSEATGQISSETIEQKPSEMSVQMAPKDLQQLPSEASGQLPPEEPARAADDEPECRPFQSLHTLCLTETHIHHTDHLEALTKFPSLKSVRLRDVPLYKEHNDEDSWKLYLASLPNIELFNGSEISATDRENSERFYLRHYLDFEEKPRRHEELEQKHGKLSKIVDIDLGGNFQKYAWLQFYINGKKSFKKRLCMRDSVDKLRTFVAKELKTSKRNFRLYYFPCALGHMFENGEFPEKEKLVANLPMSRFDMRDGDEIHIETANNIQEMDIRVVITDSRWQSRVPRD
ncbi:hypothetical protein LOTGIDRAFT_235828 [Lottia gigantea]|uniref:Ubiquitin-like domain-containing protein n=1 Tax=Lottia gigantea TaxID=225164 RepID=V3ZWN2_LOTGI|nr:hypothetical protein LOTGIDRAFT_235828 [Lottia gigantea]ESO85331.1 hypothetical protein LOTGIDRAFT_235828 [Lottia gigantea]